MAMATARGMPAVGTARAYWQAQVDAQRRSGLSQAAFCRRQRFPKGAFGFWKWTLTQEAGGGSGGRATDRGTGLRPRADRPGSRATYRRTGTRLRPGDRDHVGGAPLHRHSMARYDSLTRPSARG
jgi:hypothetical protein